jgi:acetoacetyl-CoA synthetase
MSWTPSPERVARANVTAFARECGPSADYHELWRWSVSDLEGFWGAVWEHFDASPAHPGFGRVLGRREMPGAEWFPGALVNYAGRTFHDRRSDEVAIRHASELRPVQELTWGELEEATARIRSGLAAAGVGRGDRVCALLPNIAETVAAFHACASLGAVWSSAAPEFGAKAVVDRFGQIEPKVLFAVDGYRYGGRDFDCTAKVAEIAAALPGTRMVRLGYLDGSGFEEGFLGPPGARVEFEQVAFDHPLWVLFSSGTTGLPKAIVHGHGGMLLEHLKHMHLHVDAQAGDRIFWFTTTGWMMWNFLVGVLLTEASIVLWDGSPAGAALWDLAEQAGVTTFGSSAAFIAACMKSGIEPGRGRDLSALEAVGSTGSPLAPEGFDWVREQLGDVWLFSTSGGTDMCTAFVCGVPTLPVYRGELQCRALGAKVESFDEAGRPRVGAVGELVITEPMPCMPVGFWNDPDGSRYRESYFDVYPGVWRHGDWIEITERGTAIISGRSDSTINRGGVRIGTSEIYRVVLAEPDVLDALVVDVEDRVSLFVALREGVELGDDLVAAIRSHIRTACSPRHVPDEILQAPRIPRTLSGKVLEVPVKRILQGAALDAVASRDSLADPAALDWFADLAARRSADPTAEAS